MCSMSIRDGATDKALKVGGVASVFELPDAEGGLVSSRERLKKDLLLVRPFRGSSEMMRPRMQRWWIY